MTKSATLSSPPPAPPSDEPALYDDRSAVRPRIRPRDFARARDDLERKLRFARIVLQLLPVDDPRALRLHAAILARDTAQLDELLDTLDGGSR